MLACENFTRAQNSKMLHAILLKESKIFCKIIFKKSILATRL